MGFVQNWIDRKRRRELERINNEIEELKRQGPDFISREKAAELTKRESALKVQTKSSFKMTFIAIILAAVVVFMFFYYHDKVGTLQKDLDSKENETIALQDKLDYASSQLNQTSNQLEQKAQKEMDLNSQQATMQGHINSLKKGLKDLNETVSSQQDDISDLTHEVQDKQHRIDELESCISNNTITNKMDCI